MEGGLFVISAPSGAGKTTLCQRLLEITRGIVFSTSHTTRAPREGEMDGIAYHFVTGDMFAGMIQRGEFLEWAEVHGNLYGTSRHEVMSRIGRGEDVLLDIDIQGARKIKALFPETITVFVLPPSLESLEERLRSRGTEGPEVMAVRLSNARMEMEAVHEYDYVVVNDDLDNAAGDLAAVVRSARCRVKRVLSDRPLISRLGLF